MRQNRPSKTLKLIRKAFKVLKSSKKAQIRRVTSTHRKCGVDLINVSLLRARRYDLMKIIDAVSDSSFAGLSRSISSDAFDISGSVPIFVAPILIQSKWEKGIL